MTRNVVFVHGAQVNARCWERFVPRFEAAGWTCHTPDWPTLSGEPSALREAVPEGLAAVGVEDIVDHYAAFVETLEAPVALVGHSFGGLFVQLLLSRGIGEVAVALSPAPPAGVRPTFEALRSALPIVTTFGHWKKTFVADRREFGARFANGLPEAERDAAWERYVVPTPGRLWAQSTWSPSTVTVDWKKPDRAPLLIVAGGRDRTVSASMNKSNVAKYRGGATTELEVFPEASHFLLAEPGWEGVADRSLAFLEEHRGRMAPGRSRA